MKRKTLISVVVILIMLLNCVAPLARVYAAENTSNTITLNSELYTAVSEYMKSQNLKGFTYNDLLRTITASGSSFSSVKELSLKEKGIDDLTGLDVFTGLETLDLSGNYLTLDSNLEVINGFSSLKSLDLSTNKIDGFSWLNDDGLTYKNLNRQDILAVKILELQTKENADFEREYQDDGDGNLVFKELNLDGTYSETPGKATGMLAEFDLESLDLELDTYLTKGGIWKLDTNQQKMVRDTTSANIDEFNAIDLLDYDSNTFSFSNVVETKEAGKMYHLDAKVVNSKHKYYQSHINLYYIIVADYEKAIIFKDENFYKSVKAQLTAGQTINDEIKAKSWVDESNIISSRSYEGMLDIATAIFNYNNGIYANCDLSKYYTKDEFVQIMNENPTDFYIDYENYVIEFKKVEPSQPTENVTAYDVIVYGKKNLYTAAYDKALTLVINKDVLRNDIVSLICENEKIYDLTGLQEFIGLESNLNVSYNYIDTIKRIVELEENKEKAEAQLKEDIMNAISLLTEAPSGLRGDETIDYREIVKKYLDKLDEIEAKEKEIREKAAGTEEYTDEARQADQEALETLKSEAKPLRNDAINAAKKINRILKKLSKIWDAEAYHMGTILTPELYVLFDEPEEDWQVDIDTLKVDELNEIFISELEYLQTLENDGSLDEDTAGAIVAMILNETGFTEAEFEAGTDDNGGSEEGGPISQLVKFLGEELSETIQRSTLKNILLGIKDYEVIDSSIYDGYNLEGTDDEVDAQLRKLYKQTGLLVSNNTQEIADTVIHMPRLKNLNISVNDIESLENIEKLTKLQKLNASDNLITTIENVDWSKLGDITDLNLSLNQIQTANSLRNTLPKLENLDLSDCLFSGTFDFDFLSYWKGHLEAGGTLYSVNLSGNYFSDLTDFVNKYAGKVKRTDYSGLAEYMLEAKGIYALFHNQKITIDAGAFDADESGVVTISLPPIFENIETMDPYDTTYGVVPGTGTVNEHGKSVTFSNYNSGKNTGVVTVETTLSNRNRTDESIGEGTTCYITYTVGAAVNGGDSGNNGNTTGGNTTTGNTTDGNTTNGNNTDDNNTSGGNNNNNNNNNNSNVGTTTLTANDVLVYEDGGDKFIIVAKPNATNSSLATVLTNAGFRINTINGSKDYANDNSKVYTSEVLSLITGTGDESTQDGYEVVVLGDVDGDGDIDSIDSGYSRALKYGTLYADIQSEEERVALMDAFKETSNFRAADLNQDGSVRTNETAQLLYYRAGLIDGFNAELNSISND